MTAAFSLVIAGGVVLMAGLRNRSIAEILRGITSPAGGGPVVALSSGGIAGGVAGDIATGAAGLGGTPAKNRKLGKRMARAAGITGKEWQCMDELAMRESGWDDKADNPTSSAYGIPQDITGNDHGGPRGQIAWFISYVRSRYGTFCKAVEFHDANNWY